MANDNQWIGGGEFLLLSLLSPPLLENSRGVRIRNSSTTVPLACFEFTFSTQSRGVRVVSIAIAPIKKWVSTFQPPNNGKSDAAGFSTRKHNALLLFLSLQKPESGQQISQKFVVDTTTTFLDENIGASIEVPRTANPRTHGTWK